MAAPRVAEKWRPPLSWIVFAVLLAVLALPAGMIIWFRALDGTPSQMGPMEIAGITVALVLTLITGGVLTRTITGPINALIARTEAIGRGGRMAIAAPEEHGTRELAVLSQSFLDLAERLVERTDYVNSFAAHVSHELKSPLTSIRGSAELLLEADMSAEDQRRFLTHIIADADRLAGLLERLRDLARADVPLDAKGVALGQAAEHLQLLHPAMTISATGETSTLIALSMEAFAIVLGHLADNSAQHGATRLDVDAAGPAARCASSLPMMARAYHRAIATRCSSRSSRHDVSPAAPAWDWASSSPCWRPMAGASRWFRRRPVRRSNSPCRCCLRPSNYRAEQRYSGS